MIITFGSNMLEYNYNDNDSNDDDSDDNSIINNRDYK